MDRLLPFVLITVIIFVQLERTLCIWNFSAVDLPDDVPIWRFAVWRNRAFLAIPNFLKKNRNNNGKAGVTLLEAGWPEPAGNNPIIGITDPGIRAFPKSPKVARNKCEKLLSVTGLDVDHRGRLWVLDSPDQTKNYCPAKIVIYDLRRNDQEIVRANLKDVPTNNLRSLVIDPFVGISGARAYIGDPGDESIIVYSLNQGTWWKLQLQHLSSIPRVYSTEMAISRKNSLLYITSAQSENIFSIDLEESRNDEVPSRGFPNIATNHSVPVKWHGTKMGSSSGMICDQRGGLHYFLVTEHASVRWDTKHDLKTSSHLVLLQSEEVPCITDYRADVQRNIWGLVNLDNPFAKSASTNLIKKWKPTFRTIRIYKYNPFGP